MADINQFKIGNAQTNQQSTGATMSTEQEWQLKQKYLMNQPASNIENTSLAKGVTAYTGRKLGEAGKKMIGNIVANAGMNYLQTGTVFGGSQNKQEQPRFATREEGEAYLKQQGTPQATIGQATPEQAQRLQTDIQAEEERMANIPVKEISASEYNIRGGFTGQEAPIDVIGNVGKAAKAGLQKTGAGIERIAQGAKENPIYGAGEAFAAPITGIVEGALSDKKTIAGEIKNNFVQGIEKINPENAVKSSWDTLVGATQTMNGLIDTALSPATGTIAAGMELPENQKILLDIVKNTPESVKEKFSQVSTFLEQNPDVATLLEGALNLAGTGIISKEARQAGIQLGKQVGNEASMVGKEVLGAGKEVLAQAPKAGETYLKIEKGIKNVLEAKKIAKTEKVLTKIENSVDEFLKSKISLSRETEKLKDFGVDIKKELSLPDVFNGLKVVDGKVNVDDAVAVLEKNVDNLHSVTREVIDFANDRVPKITKTELRAQALQRIDNLTPADKAAVIKRIDNQLNSLPDDFSVSQLDDFRAQARKSARDAKGQLKSGSEYSALENASRDLVFSRIENLPNGIGKNFPKIRQSIKNGLDTVKFLENKLNGQIVKGGRLTRLMNKTYGAVAGSMFGPLGSIAGAELSGFLTDLISNNQLGNAIKSKMIKKLLSNTPEEIKMADEIIKKIGEYQPLMLSAPTSQFRTQAISGDAIRLPSSPEDYSKFTIPNQ